MAFMVPHYLECRAWHVDTKQGVLPFFAVTPFDGIADDALDDDKLAAWFAELLGESPEDIYSVYRDNGPGFYVRLSADGYMDCTDWDGPHATMEHAKQAVIDAWDVDPEMGDESEPTAG